MAVKRFYFFGSYGSFRPFIMEIESDGNGEFTIPTTGGGYSYDVKTLPDGQIFGGVTGNLTITFPSPNTRYDVEISGLFPRIYFNNSSERLKIKDIKQWGDVEWSSMEFAFFGCSNLQVSATDTPDLSNVTSMRAMFTNATSLNVDVDYFTSSHNNTSIRAFVNSVNIIHNVRLDCTNVIETGGSSIAAQPFWPRDDSSNANIELHNLSIDIWFTNSGARDYLTSSVTFYNMILTFDHSASATITMTTLQKNNLLSYLQANINPVYTTLQDWLTDIGSNWTIA